MLMVSLPAYVLYSVLCAVFRSLGDGRTPLLGAVVTNLVQLGADKAYALDGGQTTVIAMDGELISAPDYGYQRQISDIIYFATALPEGG